MFVRVCFCICVCTLKTHTCACGEQLMINITHKTFILTDTARLNTKQPSYQRCLWNRMTAMYSNNIASGSLNRRKTKIEWIRYEVPAEQDTHTHTHTRISSGDRMS